RLHGRTGQSLPISLAVSSRAPWRVPESASVAPAAARALAISRPIPPLAPVTRARFPVRSNMSAPWWSKRAPGESLRLGIELGHKGVDVGRCADGLGGDIRCDPLGKAGQHLPRTDLDQIGDAALTS